MWCFGCGISCDPEQISVKASYFPRRDGCQLSEDMTLSASGFLTVYGKIVMGAREAGGPRDPARRAGDAVRSAAPGSKDPGMISRIEIMVQ